MIARLLSSSLFRASGIYAVSAAINAAIPFLMMPVLTRYLTTTDYGIVSMFGVLVGVASPFVGLNLHGAVSVRYFEKPGPGLARYIGNCLLLLGATIVVVGLVTWLFSGFISRHTMFPREWLWAVVLFAACQFLVQLIMALWQVENKALTFGAFQSAQTVLNVALTLVLVVGLGMNWQGRVDAQLATMAFFALLGLYFLRRGGWVTFEIDREDIRHALAFGVPLIPHALGGMLMAQTGRLFVTGMAGVSETGIYTVGLQIGMILEVAASSFNRAYVPWLYARLSANDAAVKVRIVRFTYVYFVVILASAGAVALAAPWFLGHFVGERFRGAYTYTAWTALGCAFSGMYYMVANYIFFSNKTHILAAVTLVTAVANVGLSYVLIRANGPTGAAQATALASLASFVLTWALSARVYKMPWNLLRSTPR